MNQFETPPGIPHGLTRNTTLRRSGHLGAALSIALLLPLASACGDSTGAPTDGAGNANIELQIAPLNLEQIGYACYDVTVYAITDPITLDFAPVWSRGNYLQPHRTAGAPSPVVDADTLCSNLFGNGPQGDILYIGTCDATYTTHVVEIVIDGLYKPLGEPLPEGSDWNNPCTASNPCQFYAECRENADTPVVISLTILRSANQGFFDIAVRFDEIFCSAKVDCEYSDNGDANGDWNGDAGSGFVPKGRSSRYRPIELVHNGDGEPSTTAVIGFACTAGPGVEDETELYLNAPRIECGAGDVRAITQSGTMCHHGGGDDPEFLSFNFFNVFAAPPGGWDGDWDGGGTTVTQAIETNHWTGALGMLARQGDLPLADSNTPANAPYDAVVPFSSLSQDTLLAFAIRFGNNPLQDSGDNDMFESIHLAVVARDPMVGLQWQTLHVLPGLAPYIAASEVLRDPTTGNLLVTGISMEPGPNNTSIEVEDLLVFEPLTEAPWFELAITAPTPPDTDISPRMFVNDIVLASYSADPDYGQVVNKVAWGADGGARIDISNMFGAPPSFTVATGNTFTLTIIDPYPAYIVSADRVLVHGQWSDGFSWIRFPVILELMTQVVTPGVTDYGFMAYAPAITPTFDLLSSENLSLVDSSFEYNSGRGFAWRGRQAQQAWRSYYTHYTETVLPYASSQQTWQVPAWNGVVPELVRVIEQGGGHPHLVLGVESSDIWTEQPCTTESDCISPPPWGHETFCQIISDTAPTTGICRYRRNDGQSGETHVLGYLPPGANDVVWLDAVPKPSSANYLNVRETRRINGGVSILFRYNSANDSGGYMTIQTTHVSNGVPSIANVNLLQVAPTFAAAEVEAFGSNFGNDGLHDARYYSAPDSCALVEVGFGLEDLPVEGEPAPHFEMMGALWNLAGPYIAGFDPSPSNIYTPAALMPTPAFSDYVDATLASFSGDDNAYVVLDLNHPEGYVWDEASADGPVYQYGLYYGSEELQCNGMSAGGKDVDNKEADPKPDEPVGESVSCNKKYFNIAIGLNPGWENCMLAFEGTTAKPGVITEENDLETPTNAVYPVLAARIPLWPNYGNGDSSFNNLVCGQHPINGKGSGFQTLYTMGTDKGGFPFCYRLGTDGKTILSNCDADHDYRAIDSEPIFGRSRQVRVDRIESAATAKAEAGLSVRAAALSQRTVGPRMAQFDTTWPVCAEGFEYRPEYFACLGLCGDGDQTDDEGCDDGNLENGDGCNSDCRVEVRCGDGDTLITEDQLCDGIQHCPTTGVGNGLSWDEGPGLCFWCGDANNWIRGDFVCDGVAQCSNGRDEQGCTPLPE